MAKIILKICALGTLVLLTIVTILYFPGSYDSGLAAIINKADMLKKAEGKKIVIISGSSSGYSINSPILKKEFDCNIINLGTYWGLGITFLSRLTAKYVYPGDIIIISPEYLNFSAPNFLPDDYSKKWWLILMPKDALYLYAKEGYFNFLARDISDLLRSKISGTIKNAIKGKNIFYNGSYFYTDNFNEFGDFFKIKAPENGKESENKILKQPLLINDKLRELNNFYDYCKSRGAYALLVFQPFPSELYGDNKTTIELVYSACKQKLKMPILGTPQDFLLPQQYFFTNDSNHVIRNGAELYTEKLIHLLKSYLNQEKVKRFD